MRVITRIITTMLVLPSGFASESAFRQLLGPSERAVVNPLIDKFWNYAETNCVSCHSHYDIFPMKDKATFKSAIFMYMGTEGSTLKKSSFKLYQNLATDGSLFPMARKMPPQHSIIPTNVNTLNSFTSFNPIYLGTQPLYINDTGKCFEQFKAEGLCDFFEGVYNIARTKGKTRWNRLVTKAKGLDHGKDEVVVNEDENIQRAFNVDFSSRNVYTLPKDQTISFYTRIAPDESAISFAATKIPGMFYRPVVLTNSSPSYMYHLDETKYDPTFSPRYDVNNDSGFLFGVKGAVPSNSGRAKVLSFYRPGDFKDPIATRTWTNISGYPTAAYLREEYRNEYPQRWIDRGWIGKTIVMGKRWRYVVADRKDGSGSIDLIPSGKVAFRPVCSINQLNQLALENDIASFDMADSMISPDGRFISLKSNPNKVPVIVRTKDCTLLETNALKDYYTGKGTFSHDGNYMGFHGFGADGKANTSNTVYNADYIKKLANNNVVANIFIYDIRNDKVEQITFHKENVSPYVAFFPDFSRDGRTIYYHRHGKGRSSSEIMKMDNPFY